MGVPQRFFRWGTFSAVSKTWEKHPNPHQLQKFWLEESGPANVQTVQSALRARKASKFAFLKGARGLLCVRRRGRRQSLHFINRPRKLQQQAHICARPFALKICCINGRQCPYPPSTTIQPGHCLHRLVVAALRARKASKFAFRSSMVASLEPAKHSGLDWHIGAFAQY